MKILLDTHLILWWLDNHPNLSKQARSLISDPDNTIFVSAISHWEIWQKISLDKLRLPQDFSEKLAAESFENLPLTAAHTRLIASLPWHHRDPFDRMLIAQAQSENLTFLTADEALTQYGPFVRRAS